MSNSCGLEFIQNQEGDLHGEKKLLVAKFYVIFRFSRDDGVKTESMNPVQWISDTAPEISLRGATTGASLCSCLCGRHSC